MCSAAELQEYLKLNLLSFVLAMVAIQEVEKYMITFCYMFYNLICKGFMSKTLPVYCVF